MPAIVIFQIEPAFIFNRMIFIREVSSRIYSPDVFAISQLVSEIPYSILCATVYWFLFVWPVGFGHGAEEQTASDTSSSCVSSWSCLVSRWVSFSLPSRPASRSLLCTTHLLISFSPRLPVSQFHSRRWLGSREAGYTNSHRKRHIYLLAPLVSLLTRHRYTRVLAGMLSTELHGLEITCNPDEFAVFNPPTGETYHTWAKEFVDAFDFILP
ncbi:hypothetical protein M422DRAFT_255210 [Sphaerobolus stellatus SS14]|uniref:ABC-2 type transporter transmembrane domain-containing protein n=1 Tax=Sphaerobolus stellatus (strain SS14) TaxID=990650 RepID=A0A0C9VUG1_SPHS4|nr:hypothetical protein M422DRAFT_255210 [Sphaerobolus stellatus SS14]